MWKIITGAVVIGSLLYYTQRRFAGRLCYCKYRLDGLVIIITGANSGIGKALVFELAKRGATLLLACRDTYKAEAVKQAVLKKYNVKVVIKKLDLNSFDSVINFANTVNKEFDEIYALVNNAGVFYHPQRLTENNFDVTLQTNYLGPFVLTHYLLRSLMKTNNARIVNVASDAHGYANCYDLKVITTNQTEFRCHFKAYSVSKLAVLLFTKELARKISNSGVTVIAVDPGNVETDIYRHFPPLSNPYLFALQWFIRIIVIKRPKEGAQSVVHALLSLKLSSGMYIRDCEEAVPSSEVLDADLAKKYYNSTLELLADKFFTESDC